MRSARQPRFLGGIATAASALALLLAVLLPRAANGQQAEKSVPPDVLIVLADDLSWPELTEVQTPAIDALAREGVTLSSFVGMPCCSPARHALLHGRWPRRTGMGANINGYLPPSATNPAPSSELLSLPKLLVSRGYHTALVGKWHLGQAAREGGGDPLLTAPQAHGFEHWLAGAPANLKGGDGSGYERWVRVDDGVRRIETEYATRAQRDAALAWWQATPSPKFLLVALSVPHRPVHVVPPDLLPEGFAPAAEGDEVRSERLRSMIASVDHVVGRLRAVADPARTLFVFLSDNGTAPSPDVQEEAKGTTAERGVLVPFIAAGPGLARAARSTERVSMVDVLATIAEATGAPLPEGHGPGGEDSVSFYGALLHPESWRATRPWVLTERYNAEQDDLALYSGTWKLRRVDGAESLVDLARDPEERHPLPTSGPLDGDERTALAGLHARLEQLPPRAR